MSPSRTPRWAVVALAAVPVLWAATAAGMMRPDALEARDDISYTLKWLVYDEGDLGAMVLRGANARLTDRPPGWVGTVPWADADDLADRLDAPPDDYLARYYLEYPTPALALFWAAFAVQPGVADVPFPPAVADCHHVGVAHFVPRTDDERRLWTAFRGAGQVLLGVMGAAAAALIVVLAWGYEPCGGLAGPVGLAVLPGAVFFMVNRFDVLPALFTALSFAALGRGRPGWAGALLAVGVGLKIYPVLFVPVILRYLGVRRSLRWLLGFAAVGAAMVVVSVAAVGWDGTLGPVRVQLFRDPEMKSWTLYRRLLPVWLAYSGKTRLLIVGLAVLAAVATRPRDLAGVLRRSAAVLVVFVNLAVFWSPQWVVWFLPLVVPAAGRRPGLTAAAAAVDLVNYWSFPVLFHLVWYRLGPGPKELITEGTIYLRTAAWAALAAALVWDEWRSVRVPHDDGPLVPAGRDPGPVGGDGQGRDPAERPPERLP